MLEEKDLQEISHLMTVLIENEVTPKFNTLADGQAAILDKLDDLAPKSRVEALEDDVALLKQVIRSISQEISELKKAQ